MFLQDSESMLLADATSTKILCIGPYISGILNMKILISDRKNI